MSIKKNLWKNKWAPDWLTLLSGVLIVGAFPPWNLWPLIWVCLVPWLAALRRAGTLQQAVAQGFWLSFVMSLGGFYWVAFVLQEFGNLHWTLSVLGLLGFSIFGQPQFVLFAALFKKTESAKKSTKNPSSLSTEQVLLSLLMILFLSISYVGIDWASPKIFMDTLGHALYRAQHLRQLADLGGAGLITFLIYFFNHSLWHSLEVLRLGKKSHREKGTHSPTLPEMATRHSSLHASVICALLLCALGWTYGYFRQQDITAILTQTQTGVQAAAIQGNIGDFDKIAAENGLAGAASKVIDTFTELTDQALLLKPRPEIIIWPETSYPSTFRNPHSYLDIKMDERIENYVRQLQVPLFFGGYDHSNGKDFNAFFFLSPLGRLQIYRKNILLLFGEYIPGAEHFDWVKSAFPQVGNFGRGVGPEVLTVETSRGNEHTVRVSPIICYEALFPNFIIEGARKGSQLILNITNDSWFGSWGEPQLHLALSVFRSIESRLPMLRSTNTGITSLILPDGEITQATSIGARTIMNAWVPLSAPIPTLMKSWGDWFGSFCLGVGVAGFIALRRRRRSR